MLFCIRGQDLTRANEVILIGTNLGLYSLNGWTARSREVSQPRDSGLDFSNHSEIWQASQQLRSNYYVVTWQRRYWLWLVKIGSGNNGLEPSVVKALPEPVLTNISDPIWTSLGHNELISLASAYNKWNIGDYGPKYIIFWDHSFSYARSLEENGNIQKQYPTAMLLCREQHHV